MLRDSHNTPSLTLTPSSSSGACGLSKRDSSQGKTTRGPSKRISLRVPSECYARLEALAASQRSDVATVVREQLFLGLEVTSGVHFSDGISELRQAVHSTREDVATLALALLVGNRIMDESQARAWIDRSLRSRR